MDLKHLTDQCLLNDTKKLATQERQLVIVILHHLAEMQRRRLFCNLGCSSLFAYCTDVLKYSEAQAHQKISAMRLMLEVPELEKKMEKGEISVTNVAQAQSFFRQEAKATNINLPVAKKKEVLKKLESTSTRQGQRILLSLSSQPKAVVERERAVTSDLTEIRFAADDKLLAKLKKLKGLLAHKNPNMGDGELINELCEISLEKLDPVRKAERAQRRQANRIARKQNHAQSGSEDGNRTEANSRNDREKKTNDRITSGARSSGASKTLQTLENNDHEKSTPNNKLHNVSSKADNSDSFDNSDRSGKTSKSDRRRIPATVRHQVWSRSKGVCENCNSQHALQLDHRIPIGLGGTSDAGNLRSLCRQCNQRAAIESFGIDKMSYHLNQSRAGRTHNLG